ncbi:MAG: ABC transporter permease [Clostridia bacterium]|nr:ABC transporter permease [Clostridia bacterium]
MKEINLSKERLLYLKKRRIGLFLVHFTRILTLVLFIGLWEFLARVEYIDSFLFSMPSKIISTIKNLTVTGELWLHVGTTLYETLLGFIIATAGGTIIALILWWSEFLRKVTEPFIVVLNSLPKIALGPIIIVWFGAGTKSIVFMAIIITIIVTVITMQNGFLATEKNKILLLKSLGASKFEILTKLVLPSSLPTFTSCLKINVGMAWIGSIMGEYLVSKQGIGYLIVYGGQVFRLDLVMASTVILCLLAAFMYGAVAIIEKLLLKWQN